MQDKLAKKLGPDRVELQEFPAGQIGSEERSFQDVQQGILQMTVLAVNNASIPLAGRVRPSLHLQERQGIR